VLSSDGVDPSPPPPDDPVLPSGVSNGLGVLPPPPSSPPPESELPSLPSPPPLSPGVSPPPPIGPGVDEPPPPGCSGFVLSLICSIDAYCNVSNKETSGLKL